MTNPLLYGGVAAAAYLAGRSTSGRGRSGRRADYDPGQELARLKEQKKARNIKPVLVEWYDHDESLMAGAAEWSGELVTTQERLDQLIALLKEDPAVHSFSWKSRDQWEPEWHIREISWDEWRWRRTRDRGPVYPRRSVPWAADAPIRQAQESGALPIGRGLDAYEVRVRKAQEQERRFQAKKEEGRAARGGRARGKTVPAGEVWAWKIEQWRSERAAGRSRGRATLYIQIPDFSLTSWRMPAGDPGSLPLSEVYGEGTTFGPGKWVWVSGAQDAGHDSTRLFVGVGNPRHRWNVQTLDFYVPSDTPLRVRLKWER